MGHWSSSRARGCASAYMYEKVLVVVWCRVERQLALRQCSRTSTHRLRHVARVSFTVLGISERSCCVSACFSTLPSTYVPTRSMYWYHVFLAYPSPHQHSALLTFPP